MSNLVISTSLSRIITKACYIIVKYDWFARSSTLFAFYREIGNERFEKFNLVKIVKKHYYGRAVLSKDC